MDKTKKAKKAASTKSGKVRRKRTSALPPKSKAYFLSLAVENIRCFGKKEQTLRLTDDKGRPAHWTVILGNNGTGKTTLLQCLSMFDRVDSSGGIPRITVSSAMPALQSYVAVSIGGDARVIARTGWVTQLMNNRKPFFVRKSDLKFDAIFRGTFSWESKALPVCYAYSAGRRMGSASLSDTQDDDPTANLFDDSVPLRNAEEWLLQLDYAASKPSKTRADQKAKLQFVRELLIHILPDVEDVRFTEPTKRKSTPGVEFKTLDGWVPLRGIGYGYQTTMAWLVDFASRMVERYPKSKDPLAELAVVLVDEIDLHLHPAWQRTLMAYLSKRFPNTQFIVTAHSPLFVQAAEEANLVVLRREKDHVLIDNEVKAVKGWRVGQILTSDLFDIPTERPPKLEAPLAERRKLLSKSKLTKRDRNRVAELEKEIGTLPPGESAQDAETMALLEETLAELKNAKRRSRRRDPN